MKVVFLLSLLKNEEQFLAKVEKTDKMNMFPKLNKNNPIEIRPGIWAFDDILNKENKSEPIQGVQEQNP